MNLIVAVGCVLLATLLVYRVVSAVRSKRAVQERLQRVTRGCERNSDRDFQLEVAEACFSLGQPISVHEVEPGKMGSGIRRRTNCGRIRPW